MPIDSLNFPDNFIWGTSSAGHQIEGSNEFSDWWAWEHEGLIEDGTVSGRAMDYWNRHEEDYALMAKLAYKGFRLGIEWARVEPQKGRFDCDVIEHYRRILQSLRKHGFKICLTLHHWVMPRWVAQLLPQFPMELFEQLEDRALALGHAQTVYESAQQPPAILQTLSDEATAAHDVALSEVNTPVKRGLIPAQVVNSLKGGNGYRNLAADLFTLSEATRSNWSKISGRTSMTMEELDRMENLADQINQALGIREQMPELQAAAARDRQAAYSLFIQAYDEVRAAIAYVRRKEDDVDSIMPSLYAGRNGGKKKPVVDEPAKPTTPVVTQPNENPGSPVVAPVVTPAAHAAAETRVETPSPTKPANAAMLENGPFMK